MIFGELLAAAQRQHRTTLAIGLAPVLKKLPHALQRYDDPLLPFGKAIIDATADLVCAYVFHLSAYLAYGASGAIALERTIAYVPQPVVKVLHGPFANGEYAQAAFEDAFAADVVTLAPTTDQNIVGAYTGQPNHAVLVNVDSATKSLEVTLQAFAAQWPGQIGQYAQVEPGHCRIDLLNEPPLITDWYWQEAIYSTQEDDYHTAIRHAAEALQKPPTFRT